MRFYADLRDMERLPIDSKASPAKKTAVREDVLSKKPVYYSLRE
ncbi:MAG: hypothetical protein QXO94_05350 [Candidatus Bathyarchaeia archaeon]